MDHLDDIYDAIIDGDKNATVESVKAALADGLSPKEILNDGMIAAMDEVGRLFEETEIFVPEMLVAARAMKAGLELLRPYLVKSGIEPAGKVVLGTESDLLVDSVELRDLTFTAARPTGRTITAQCQAHGTAHAATLDGSTVHFESPTQRVAPGQVVAIYDGDECLGGGIVAR